MVARVVGDNHHAHDMQTMLPIQQLVYLHVVLEVLVVAVLYAEYYCYSCSILLVLYRGRD